MSYFDLSKDGHTWITGLPVPSKLSGSSEDLDNQSFRSVVNGNINRTIVGYKWKKLSFEFQGLPDLTAKRLLEVLEEGNDIYIRSSAVITGRASNTLCGYVSKLSFEYIQTGANEGVWTISFNFVEGKR